MDKRWLLILLILIAGLACMYYIVDSSTTVGKAVESINKTYVTVPDGFSIAEAKSASATFLNKATNEKIIVKDIGKQNTSEDDYNRKLDTLKNSGDINIVKNTSRDVNGVKVYQITYENLSDANVTNLTIAFTNSCDHSFVIKMLHYSDESEMEKDLDYIVSTIRPDYKKPKD